MRPVAPDPEVLAKAQERLSAWLDDADLGEWKVGERMDRPRSSLFPLQVETSGGPVGAFYKVVLPSRKGTEDRHELRADRARTGLERTIELEDRLAVLAHGSGVSFARTLAVDPATLTAVNLKVEGEPFGSTLSKLVPGPRLSKARSSLVTTGRAAALIERCTVDPVQDREDERVDLMDRRLERIAPFFDEGVNRRLRLLANDLYAESSSGDHPFAYVHGDFSPTNIFVSEEGIGLIDFEWAPRIRTFDIANLAFRLEYDTFVPATLVAPLVTALIEGYGRPGLTESATWRYHRLGMLLKFARGGPGRVLSPRSGRRRRAIAELETMATDSQ